MKKIFRKLMILLDRRQKQKMILLVFLMLIGAVLETLGVSMILPVMNVVLEKNAVQSHRYLQVICDIFRIGYEDTRSLMILVMTGLIVIFAVKNIFFVLSAEGAAQIRLYQPVRHLQKNDDQLHGAPL